MSDSYIDENVVQSFKNKAQSSRSAMLQPVMVCEAGYWHLTLVMFVFQFDVLLWL
jgi:hypothetical protein